MNVGRGLFRAWIFLTVLWLIGAGAFAYYIIEGEVSHWKWIYINQWREDVRQPTLEEIFEGRPIPPYYEMYRSPSAEKLSVTFDEVDRLLGEWDQFVKDGTAKIVKMPDDSSLYLSTRELTEQDQQYIAKAFWDQRWRRYASFAKFWVPMLVVPPIVLFILGWAILWVCRGFKTA